MLLAEAMRRRVYEYPQSEVALYSYNHVLPEYSVPTACITSSKSKRSWGERLGFGKTKEKSSGGTKRGKEYLDEYRQKYGTIKVAEQWGSVYGFPGSTRLMAPPVLPRGTVVGPDMVLYPWDAQGSVRLVTTPTKCMCPIRSRRGTGRCTHCGGMLGRPFRNIIRPRPPLQGLYEEEAFEDTKWLPMVKQNSCPDSVEDAVYDHIYEGVERKMPPPYRRSQSHSPSRHARSPSSSPDVRLKFCRQNGSKETSESQRPVDDSSDSWEEDVQKQSSNKKNRKSILECDVSAYDLITKYLKSEEQAPKNNEHGLSDLDELSDELSDNAVETEHKKAQAENSIPQGSKLSWQNRIPVDAKNYNWESTPIKKTNVTIGGQRIQVFDAYKKGKGTNGSEYVNCETEDSSDYPSSTYDYSGSGSSTSDASYIQVDPQNDKENNPLFYQCVNIVNDRVYDYPQRPPRKGKVRLGPDSSEDSKTSSSASTSSSPSDVSFQDPKEDSLSSSPDTKEIVYNTGTVLLQVKSILKKPGSCETSSEADSEFYLPTYREFKQRKKVHFRSVADITVLEDCELGEDKTEPPLPERETALPKAFERLQIRLESEEAEQTNASVSARVTEASKENIDPGGGQDASGTSAKGEEAVAAEKVTIEIHEDGGWSAVSGTGVKNCKLKRSLSDRETQPQKLAYFNDTTRLRTPHVRPLARQVFRGRIVSPPRPKDPPPPPPPPKRTSSLPEGDKRFSASSSVGQVTVVTSSRSGTAVSLSTNFPSPSKPREENSQSQNSFVHPASLVEVSEEPKEAEKRVQLQTKDEDEDDGVQADRDVDETVGVSTTTALLDSDVPETGAPVMSVCIRPKSTSTVASSPPATTPVLQTFSALGQSYADAVKNTLIGERDILEDGVYEEYDEGKSQDDAGGREYVDRLSEGEKRSMIVNNAQSDALNVCRSLKYGSEPDSKEEVEENQMRLPQSELPSSSDDSCQTGYFSLLFSSERSECVSTLPGGNSVFKSSLDSSQLNDSFEEGRPSSLVTFSSLSSNTSNPKNSQTPTGSESSKEQRKFNLFARSDFGRSTTLADVAHRVSKSRTTQEIFPLQTLLEDVPKTEDQESQPSVPNNLTTLSQVVPTRRVSSFKMIRNQNRLTCQRSQSDCATRKHDLIASRSKFYLPVPEETEKVLEEADALYEQIREPVYEELPECPLYDIVAKDEEEEDSGKTEAGSSSDERVTPRSMFEGASKDDILTYLADAKERGISLEEEDGLSSGQLASLFSSPNDEEVFDSLANPDEDSSLNIKNRNSHSRTSTLSKRSDSSDEAVISREDSFTKERRSSVEIERNDSGVGSETSKPARVRRPTGQDDSDRLCYDCDEVVEPETTTSGETVVPLVCRVCGRRRAERKETISEVVETEVKYGTDLLIIKEEFCRPMLVAGLLSSEQLTAIFLNLDELIEVNARFTERLRDALEIALDQGDEDLTTVRMGKLFLENSAMLHAFESYCTRQGASSVLLAALEKEKELLRIFLRVSQMENTLLRRMNLPAFLMVPVQRVTKYPLLLARLYKVTPKHHEDRKYISEAQTKIQMHLRHMNSETKEVTGGKLWRRISMMSANGPRRTSTDHSVGNLRLRKVAMEALDWGSEDVRFAMEGRLQFTQSSDNVFTRRSKTLRLATCLAALITLGKPDARYRPELAGQTMFFPRGCGIRAAALVLVRDKQNHNKPLIRDPFNLEKCIVNLDPDVEDCFELHDFTNNNAFVLKGEDSKSTQTWYNLLQYHCLGMGQWRSRRGALPNIMITPRNDS